MVLMGGFIRSGMSERLERPSELQEARHLAGIGDCIGVAVWCGSACR